MSLRMRQAAVILGGVIVAIAMAGLGLWQMARFQTSMADVAAQRAAEPAVQLAAHVAEDGTVEDVYGRRAEVTGSFVEGHSVWVGTENPMRLAQAFRLEDGRYIAVVLGAGDPAEGQPVLPSGSVVIEGIFTAGDAAGTEQVSASAPEGSLPTLRLPALVQSWPQPLIAGYLTLQDDPLGTGLASAPVQLPEGGGTAMHEGYAIQWWVFAGAAIAFSVITARQMGSPRQVTPAA
ncbi:MAG: SURF1 family protein [Arachnia sp.]